VWLPVNLSASCIFTALLYNVAMKPRQKIAGPDVKQELLEGQSRELLQQLHLLTRDGDLNADARRKLKQVNHLINLLRPGLDDLLARFDDPIIVDVGSGKSYLGFLLYDLYLRQRDCGRIIGIESRPELVTAVRDLAAKAGFERMEFQQALAESAALPQRVHMLVALHACDTATDDAILLGLKNKAEYIAVVPCCQAQVAQQLKSLKDSPLADLYAHAIHRREFGSHLTNVFRTLALQAAGYQVSVTELVGWEHSLKNEFILARRIGSSFPPARSRLQRLLEQFPIHPKLPAELGYCDKGNTV